MGQRKALTEHQLVVLRWIAEGCPDGVWPDTAHRISAGALRNRGMVKTSGRGSTWTASITTKGKEYLKLASGPRPPTPREPNESVTTRLVRELLEAGGSMRVPREWGRGRVDYQRRVQLVEQQGKFPVGKRITLTVASPDEWQMDLVDGPPGGDPPLRPVPVPEAVRRYHPVVASFRKRRERHEVTRASLPRASLILQGLVVEAESRGYQVTESPDKKVYAGYEQSWAASKDGHIVIEVDGERHALRVHEEGLKSRTLYGRPDTRIGTGANGFRGQRPRIGDYEKGGTGRLSLTLVSGYSRRGSTWGDRKSWRLEEKLPALLRELDIRRAEAKERVREEQRKRVEREQAWEEAKAVAKQRLLEHLRTETLGEQLRRWTRARQIRAFCDAVEAASPTAEVRAWLDWSRSHADRIDPLVAGVGVPVLPEEIPPGELRPFLDGWDPYRPERSLR